MLEDYLRYIADLYNKQKAIYKDRYKKGDFFNVFNILGLSRNETRTHSAFLAELLDPHGSHGMGNAFLIDFITRMHLEDLRLDLQHAYVEVERVIGGINENYDKGGRIDIIVVSGSKAIIIENKIDAQDQYKQLVRYNNYAKDTFTDYRLLYLTLDKDAASDASTLSDSGQLMPNVDYYPITYRDDIIAWLSDCVAATPDQSSVNVIVNQYKELLKDITNTMEENNLVLDALKKEGNWAYTLEVLKNGEAWKNEVWNTFLQLLRIRVEAEGWLLESKGIGRIFVRTNPDSEYFIAITQEGGSYIGITSTETKEPQTCLSILEKPNAWWPFGWKWLEGSYRYFLPQSDPNSIEYLFPEYREVFMDYLMHEISLVMHEAEKAGIDL